MARDGRLSIMQFSLLIYYPPLQWSAQPNTMISLYIKVIGVYVYNCAILNITCASRLVFAIEE